MSMQDPYKRQILKPGENSQVDVQRDANGGCLYTVRMPEQTIHFRLDREASIGCALAMLRQAGVPMDEAYNRQKAANQFLTMAGGKAIQ